MCSNSRVKSISHKVYPTQTAKKQLWGKKIFHFCLISPKQAQPLCFVYTKFPPFCHLCQTLDSFRLTKSDFREPVNIGSDEMVNMNEMAGIVLSFENKKLPIRHIPGPEGVRGRNSDNTLIKEKLGWAPTMRLKVLLSFASFNNILHFLLYIHSWTSFVIVLPHLPQDGLRVTYFWIKEQIEKEKFQGVDLSVYGSSKVVGTQAPVLLGSLHAADDKEWNANDPGSFWTTFLLLIKSAF